MLSASIGLFGNEVLTSSMVYRQKINGCKQVCTSKIKKHFYSF